jgi:hypothetical protein
VRPDCFNPKGSLLKVDTPQNIINNYDKTIYDVQAKTPINYSRFKKNYPSQHGVFLPLANTFIIDKQEDFNPQELEKYLKSIVIKTS